MLRKFMLTAFVMFAWVPAVLAETVTGKIQSIDTTNNRVLVQTNDGQTATFVYAPGTLTTAKLTEGSEVRLSPKQTQTGRVVGTFRNYVRVRPDVGTTTHSAEFIAIPPGPQRYRTGDRVLILSRCRIIKTSEDVVGYLIPGEIVPEVRLAAIEYAKPQPVVLEPRVVREVSQPAPAPIPAPPARVQPVRALW